MPWSVHNYMSTLIDESFNYVLIQSVNTESAAPDSKRGLFSSRQELDKYERMWHSMVYQPSWNELQPKVAVSYPGLNHCVH